MERMTAMKWKRSHKAAIATAAMACMLFSLTACTAPEQTATATKEPAATQDSAQTETAKAQGVYQKISPADAKTLMETRTDYTLLDVRELSEYSAGHIAGAKLLPLGQIESLAATELPDLNATILVYCRSGARSSRAAQTLLSLGYTDVLDLGGISSWPYEVVLD